MGPKARETIEIPKKTVDEPAGPGAYVTHDSMNREEQEMELFAGFLRWGHSAEVVKEKAREFLELGELTWAMKPQV